MSTVAIPIVIVVFAFLLACTAVAVVLLVTRRSRSATGSQPAASRPSAGQSHATRATPAHADDSMPAPSTFPWAPVDPVPDTTTPCEDSPASYLPSTDSSGYSSHSSDYSSGYSGGDSGGFSSSSDGGGSSGGCD